MSGEPDRDRSVERVLRRSVSNRLDTPASTPCLDPETLAAWADGALDRDERTAAEAHVADCARCQLTLAALVRTAPPAEPAHSWWRLGVGWLVPLAAAATALVIWIAVPDNQRTFSPLRDAPQTAAPQIAEPPSAAATPAPEQKRDELQSRQGQPTVAQRQKAADESRAEREQAVDKTSTSELAKAAPSPPADGLDAPRRNAPAPAAPESTRADAKELAPPPASAAPVSPASPPPTPTAAQALGAGATADSQTKSTNLARFARPASAIAAEIVSPDPASRWRLGGGRVVERSTDGGATWQAQAIGAGPNLTAGTSPSATVCWLVGRSGTVLLTTDGRVWQTVASPVMTDLASVRATDARTATVTATDGRSFRTADGGLTWER